MATVFFFIQHEGMREIFYMRQKIRDWYAGVPRRIKIGLVVVKIVLEIIYFRAYPDRLMSFGYTLGLVHRTTLNVALVQADVKERREAFVELRATPYARLD